MFVFYNQINIPLGNVAPSDIIKIPVTNSGEGMIPNEDGTLEIVNIGVYKANWSIPCKSTLGYADYAIIELRTVEENELLGSCGLNVYPNDTTVISGSTIFLIDKPNTLIKLVNASKNTINIPIIKDVPGICGSATYTVYKIK